MPKERGRVPPPPKPKEHAPEPYALTARYADDRSSEQPYYETQQLIFENQQLDLSAFRLQLRRLDAPDVDWFVAIVGTRPASDVDSHFRRILSTGELVNLPEDIQAALFERRAALSTLGPWVEGHYGPGRRRRLR